MSLPFLLGNFLEEWYVPLGYGLPFGKPEDHDGGDEYGVFPEATGTAYLEGEAFLGKGDERCTMRGAHIQQTMRERPESEAIDERGGQGAHKFVEREEPEHEPPAKPM